MIKLNKPLLLAVLAAMLLAVLLPASALAQAEGPYASMEQGSGDGQVRLLSVSEGLQVGDTSTYTVYLANLPATITGAEFVCSYDDSLVSVDNLQLIDLPGLDHGLFGADAISTSNNPGGGSFTFAVASLPPATASPTGGVFSLDVTGVAAGSFDFTCSVRISTGSVLTSIGFVPLTITITEPATDATISGNLLPFNSALSGSKTITINLTDGVSVDEDHTVDMRAGGSFSFTVAPGTYTISASAPGYLRAIHEDIVVVAGDTVRMENLNLLAGDINADDAIGVLDVATIGANYNLTTPTAADLNGSGRINLLDLQLLAPNYGITGPSAWDLLP